MSAKKNKINKFYKIYEIYPINDFSNKGKLISKISEIILEEGENLFPTQIKASNFILNNEKLFFNKELIILSITTFTKNNK